MFSQPSSVDETQIKLLGINLFWQPIVPEASFGSTGEWTVLLKNKSKANQQELLEVFANTPQGKRYQSLKLISISQLGDTTTLAQCFQK